MSLMPISSSSPTRRNNLRLNKPLPKNISPLKDAKHSLNNSKKYWVNQRFSPQKNMNKYIIYYVK